MDFRILVLAAVVKDMTMTKPKIIFLLAKLGMAFIEYKTL